MHIQFQLAQQCIQISTRINSSSVHTYIFVCFIRNSLRVILQGFLTQNATIHLAQSKSTSLKNSNDHECHLVRWKFRRNKYVHCCKIITACLRTALVAVRKSPLVRAQTQPRNSNEGAQDPRATQSISPESVP